MNLPRPIEPSTVLPNTQRKSMFPAKWSTPAWRNIDVITVSHQGTASINSETIPGSEAACSASGVPWQKMPLAPVAG